MHIKSTLVLVILIGMASCHSDSSSSSLQTISKETGAQIPGEIMEQSSDKNFEQGHRLKQPAPPDDFSGKVSKIIKNGEMSFEVTSLQESKSKVDALLTSIEGYYENETYHSNTYNSSYTLKIRVPSHHFENLIRGLEDGTGKLTVKNLRANDVTERYIDLKIKIDNNLAYLKRYNELLNKADSIEDMMEIQDKTRDLEAEINSLKGSLEYLNDKAAFSSLNLSLIAKSERIITKDHFGTELVEAIKTGFNGFKHFILAVTTLWPFLILGCLLFAFRSRIKWPFRKTKK